MKNRNDQMLKLIKDIYGIGVNFYFKRKARRVTGWKLHSSKRLKLKLLLNRDNLIDFLISEKEVFEEEVVVALDHFKAQKSFLFIDVGSQLGQFSLYVKKNFPQSEVLSFEPLQDAFVQQKMNMIINQLSYFLYNLAISDSNGSIPLFIPSSSYKDAYGKSNFGMASLSPVLLSSAEKTSVSSVRLDDFHDTLLNFQMVLVKIDVEGCETLVIRGGKKILQSEMEIYIIVELLFETLPEKAREVNSILYQWGYRMCNQGWEESTPSTLKNGNYFYRRFL